MIPYGVFRQSTVRALYCIHGNAQAVAHDGQNAWRLTLKQKYRSDCTAGHPAGARPAK